MSTSRKTDGADIERQAAAPTAGSAARVGEARPQPARKAAAAAAVSAPRPVARAAGTAPVTTQAKATTAPPIREVAPPREPKDTTSAGLELLLRIEAMARNAADLMELRHLIANETRKLNRARQIFVVEIAHGGVPRTVAASGVAALDQHSTLAGAIEQLVARMGAEQRLADAIELTLPAYCAPDSELALAYPFREMLWLPLLDRGKTVFAGLLLARENVWTSDDVTITRRLVDAYAHAWRELATMQHFRPRFAKRTRWKLAAAAAALLLLAVPVPMTALAPAEIVAAAPFVVAAPIDAVIEAVAVEPSAVVAAGDVLVRFTDTVLRNRVEVARREVAVAESRVKQATILAFSDSKGRHELGIAMAELDLKKAEMTYASEMLDKSVLRAERAGIAIYADRKALIGRPVATGERIMEIADPSHVEVRVDLPLPDAIALRADSTIKLFLDVDPLQPWGGAVTRSDYRARPSDSDVLSFRTFATVDASDRALPRIGLRGTAQVYGGTTPLVVFLFRRPLSAARQWLGL